MAKTVSRTDAPYGKLMGTAVYVHRTAVDSLAPMYTTQIADALHHVPDDHNYDIVKLDVATGNISFIESPDWDAISEPHVGYIFIVRPSDVPFMKRPTNQIYHHKWQFVAPGYTGFNVREAMHWSYFWTTHPDVIEMKRTGIKNNGRIVPFSRVIGNDDAWQRYVLNTIRPEFDEWIQTDEYYVWSQAFRDSPEMRRWLRTVAK